MRFVIFGAGAIGGVVGARLHQAGSEVMLIARGEHFAAVRDTGLTLHSPNERVVLPIPVAATPAHIGWDDRDVVLLATKSQDTATALEALRAVAPADLPIVCLQNGVENERSALRMFARVYGAVVMVPATHLEPGVVSTYGASPEGVIDLGRYPRGTGELAEAVCAALRGAGYDSRARPDIMPFKYSKLISNLGNGVQAICGHDHPEAEELIELAKAEAMATLRATGIEFLAPEADDVVARFTRIAIGEIDGRARTGSSTWQSVARGTGTIETDYLNGEIVLIGRAAGVATPVNALIQTLAAHTARERRPSGWLTPRELLERLRP
jgi:2-dehydropantoate 2-reductase